jgi:GTP-binding protein
MKIDDIRFVIGAASLEATPRDRRAQVAFIGPSNVGKSSLLNALAGRKAVAKVSKTPGRTQQLNFFLVNDAFYLVDLPGYGFAKAPDEVQRRFRRLAEDYLAGSKALRLLVVLLDVRRDPSARDVELLTWLRDQRVPHVIVLTKADKVSRPQLARRAEAVGASLCDALGADAVEIMPVSAVTRLGCRELWQVIGRAAAREGHGDSPAAASDLS